MGLKITVTGDMEKYISNYEKKLIEDIEKKIEKEKPKVTDDVLNLVDDKLNEFYDKSISTFYGDYSPVFYSRKGTGGMSDMFKTKKEGTSLSFWFDEHQMVSRTGYSGEDGIYKTVFIEGWHGGSGKNGNMSYPVAYEDGSPKPYNGKYKPYDDCRYGWVPAARAPISPYNNFIDQKENYEKNGFRKDYRDIWISHLKNIGINVR
ncbi:hypothetical protein [Eubacterium ramulus]|uniref:hypothetical protein n=1 Tax=Eubacterium ramulus TaxID=39490 RepID=UPI0039994CD7